MGTGRLPGLERCRLKYGGYAVSAAWPLFVYGSGEYQRSFGYMASDFEAGNARILPETIRERGPEFPGR